MKNSVFVRNNKSIKTISLARMSFMFPLIIYGFYQNHLTNLIGLFKPLIFIFGGALIGFLVNIIYEKIIMKNKEKIIDCAFSSFHIEYGLILGMIVSDSIAIIFGKFLSKKVPDNIINLCSGLLFLIFGFIGFINFIL